MFQNHRAETLAGFTDGEVAAAAPRRNRQQGKKVRRKPRPLGPKPSR